MRPRQAGFISSLLAALLLLVVPQGLFAQSPKEFRNLKFQANEGEVHLSVPGHQQLIPVRDDTRVKVNDLNGVGVITNKGWAEFTVDNRLRVIQESDSALTFVSTEAAEKGTVLRLELERGTSTFTVDPGKNNAIVVRASGVEVRATKKARFRMDADPDSARVTVFDGKVKVTSAEETLEVAKGYSLTFSAGTLTRLAQQRTSAWSYGRTSKSSSQSRFPSLGGFTMVGMSFGSSWDCGWSSYGYYGGFNPYWYGGIYGYPYGSSYGYPYGGWGGCWWPYYPVYWQSPHRPVTTPPPTVVPVPAPRPPVVTRPPVDPRGGIDPGKRGKRFDLLTTENETQPRGGSGTTMRVTPAAQSPRFAPAPEVLRPVVTRGVNREDVPIPHRNAPMTDRVDVQPIPRERAGRGDTMPRAGDPGGYRDTSGSRPSSGGSDRSGYNPRSGGGDSGGSAPRSAPSGGYAPSPSPGGSSPAPRATPPPAPLAPPPAAPAPAPTQPTPRKPD